MPRTAAPNSTATIGVRIRIPRGSLAFQNEHSTKRSNRDKNVHSAFHVSTELNEILSALSAVVGISIRLVPVDSLDSREIRLVQAVQQHPFGALLLNTESERRRCVNHLKKLIDGVTPESLAQLSASICGFSYLVMPLNSQGLLIGILLAGPMFPRVPRSGDWMRTSRRLRTICRTCSGRSARSAYFQIPVVPAARLDGLIRLLAIFARLIAENAARYVVSADKAQMPGVARAQEFIKENASTPLTVSTIARQASLHPDYLGKLFKNATGMTLTEYVARVRVENVKELLPKSSCRVAEAAFAAGFQSLAQFNRLFKRYTGVSPSRYRASLFGR